MTSNLIEPRRIGESSLLEFHQFLEENGGWEAANIVGERVVRKKCATLLGAMDQAEDNMNDDSMSIWSSEFEVTDEDTWPEFLTRIWDDGLDFVLDAFVEVLDSIRTFPVFHFTVHLLFRFHMLE